MSRGKNENERGEKVLVKEGQSWKNKTESEEVGRQVESEGEIKQLIHRSADVLQRECYLTGKRRETEGRS